MAFRLALVAVVLVAAQAAVIQYPAGVSAATCLNYPFCDIGIDPVTGHVRPEVVNNPNYVPNSLKYPAGVSAAACFNYPYCQENIDPATGLPYLPAGTHHSAILPADVHPSLATGVEQRQQEFLRTGIVNLPAGVNAAAYYTG